MKTKEIPPPKKLEKTQIWFASIITQPLIEDNQIRPITPSQHSIEEEAQLEIRPSPTLKPWERMQVYNQQYWWRLIGIMQELYPLVTRLFGYNDFNEMIAIPYLNKYPSNHWSIDSIGNRLPKWIEKDYQGDDKELVRDAVALDLAFNLSFVSVEKPVIDISHLQEEELDQLIHRRIFLQPYIHLFAFDHNLFQFRDEMLAQEPEYWIEHDFPQLPQEKRYYGIIYRSKHDNIVWDSLSSVEFHILWKFQEGCTIEAACEWLERQDAAMSDEAAAHIHFWFQEWTMRGWLTLTKP